VIRLRKKLLVVALIVAITVPMVAYAWTEIDEGSQGGKNQEPSTDVTKFKAVVNGMTSIDVFVCVDIADGLTEEEAELIVGTTFIKVKGDYVTHRLDTLTFSDTQIEAHYTWGHDENDMGHIFDITTDLITLQITVSHCF